MHKHNTSHTQGFTIVELLIVIVVIAILAAISMVAYSNIQSRERDSAAESTTKQLTNAIRVAEVTNGQLVPASSELSAMSKDELLSFWGARSLSGSLLYIQEVRGPGVIPDRTKVYFSAYPSAVYAGTTYPARVEIYRWSNQANTWKAVALMSDGSTDAGDYEPPVDSGGVE